MHHPRLHSRRPNIYPQTWLITDERNDAALEDSIRALPSESGIIFRHYHLDQTKRQQRFSTIRSIACRRGHLLLLADTPCKARAWGADGIHGRHWGRRDTGGLIHSAPVHDTDEIRMARQNGADLFFLSPAFVTRSHADQRPLSHLQVKRLVELCNKPVILLGGMNKKRFRHYQSTRAHGWAAIDSLTKKRTKSGTVFPHRPLGCPGANRSKAPSGRVRC